MDLLILASEYAASEPVNPARGSVVLTFVVIVAVLMLLIPTRKK